LYTLEVLQAVGNALRRELGEKEERNKKILLFNLK
jgi:hypothetical protein